MSATPKLRHPAVDAALSAAASVLGMEVVFIGAVDETAFWFERVLGDWPGIGEGVRIERADTFCHRMLGGGACATADAAVDPIYADVAVRERLGIHSYVGVPIRLPDGALVGTLCGIDHRSVGVTDAAVGVLRDLARVVAAHVTSGDGVVIRRTPDGWAVGDQDGADDLTSAMVLADLLQDDLRPRRRPPRPEPVTDETTRLRVAVSQLEHALAARVAVEQAIGVLAERFGIGPRDAFDRLRKVARRSGERVHDLAGRVVASTPGHPGGVAGDLPDELRARR